MRQINLLPVRIREQRGRRQAGLLLLAALFLGGLAVGALWMFWHAEGALVGQRLESAKKAVQEQQTLLAKRQSSLAPDRDLAGRIQQLNTLSQSEVNWAAAFKQADLLVAKDVKLTSLVLAAGTGDMTVKINGEAPSNLSFASFVETLKANHELKGISIDGYSYSPSTGTVTFALTVQVPATLITYKPS